tara:strand:+ start:11823 stop:11987 length:165 start_codon:yes stop_codon:yes gene_type:complete
MKIFRIIESPLFIRVWEVLRYFSGSFCGHLPIGRYGQKKKQYVLCTAFEGMASI